MKPIYFFIISIITYLFFSCTSDMDDRKDIISIRIDHYLETAVGSGPQLVFRTQQDEKIGGEDWLYFYDQIEGFEYQQGFIYDLEISREKVLDPPADASSYKYYLEKLISKTPAPISENFVIRLKSSSLGENFVTYDEVSGYKIMNEIAIHCGDLCEDLRNALMDQQNVNGVFSHLENGALELEEIIIL